MAKHKNKKNKQRQAHIRRTHNLVKRLAKRKKRATIKRVLKNKINSNQALYKYARDNSLEASKLYDQVNYYIRQHFFARGKDPEKLHENTREACQELEEWTELLNKSQKQKNQKIYEQPSAKKSINNKSYWDALLVVLTEHGEEKFECFSRLPGQTAQHVIQDLCNDWKSFWKSIKDYRKHPEKYKGEPKPPKYKGTNHHMTIHFTPQQCKIKNNDKTGDNYSTFPCTEVTFNLGKVELPGQLKEVRIVPKGMRYDVEFVYEQLDNFLRPCEYERADYQRRIIGFDPGISNYLTIFNNIGEDPIVVNGGMLKARNQYANKKSSQLKSQLPHGTYTSSAIQGVWDKRNAFMHDFMHRLSAKIIQICLDWRIDTIVIGHNKGWKFKPSMGRKNNQNFACIPLGDFVSKLKYKAYEHGIEVIVTEESYTSKASFLDNDLLPVYGEPGASSVVFSGKRISRSWYRSSDGTLLHADVNAAANAICKVFPSAFDLFESRRDSGVVNAPRRLDLGYVS